MQLESDIFEALTSDRIIHSSFSNFLCQTGMLMIGGNVIVYLCWLQVELGALALNMLLQVSANGVDTSSSNTSTFSAVSGDIWHELLFLFANISIFPLLLHCKALIELHAGVIF